MTTHALAEKMCTDRWYVVNVKVRFFNALAMVTLRVREAKQSLFQKVTAGSQYA